MKHPKLKEIKKHFENAKTIRPVRSDIEVEVNIYMFIKNDTGVNEYDEEGEILFTDGSYHCIYSKEGRKYAKILTYKEKTFSITESQIKEIKELALICKPASIVDKIKELFPSAFEEEKKELVVGKWYKRVDSQKFLFCFQGEFGNAEDILDISYGFSHNGTWSNELSIHINSEFIEATSEEVKSALENEAVKRGFKAGIYVDRSSMHSNTNSIQIPIGNKYSFDFKFNILYLNEREIFSKGQWASVFSIKQMTQAEIETELGYPVEIIK